MKVKKIRNKNSQREIRNSNRSNRRFNFFPPSKKKREGGKKIENIELSNPSVLFCIEGQKERMNQSCVDRGKFTWPVVLVGPRCIRLRVLLGKLDYNGTDIVFNDIRNKSSTCIIVGDTQMRARTVEMELAGSSVHVKIYNKRVSTRATLINTLGHRERSFACRILCEYLPRYLIPYIYIPKFLFSSENFPSIYKNLRTRKF